MSKLSLPIAVIALAATTAIGITLIVYGLNGHPTIPEHLSRAAVTETSTPRPETRAPTPSSSMPAAQTPPAAASGLTISSARLTNVPLLPLDVPSTGVIEPPSFGDAYVLRGQGFAQPGSTATNEPVVIAVHASTDPTSSAIGNGLWDRERAVARVHAGETIDVDGINYTITRTEVTPKRGAQRPEEWTQPDSLVLVTCAEDTSGGPATSNLIVYAKHDDAAHN